MEQYNSPQRDSPARQYPTAESISGDPIGKIAEPVAAYIHAPSQGITPTRRFIAGISAAEPVWRFAVANELIPHLETAVRLVRESFQKVYHWFFNCGVEQLIEFSRVLNDLRRRCNEKEGFMSRTAKNWENFRKYGQGSAFSTPRALVEWPPPQKAAPPTAGDNEFFKT